MELGLRVATKSYPLLTFWTLNFPFIRRWMAGKVPRVSDREKEHLAGSETT